MRAILLADERKDRTELAEFRLRTWGLYESPDYAGALPAVKTACTGSTAPAKALLAMLRADLVIQKKPEERDEPSMRVEEDITRILHAREKLNASTESAFMHLCRKWDEMVAL